jgi:3-oxoacyl-[acyl-carrier protein] reductase
MDLGLAGKKAIVTGGSKGIGRAIAETLAAEGAQVSICARNAEGVASAVEALKGRGVKAFGRALDVTDRDALVGWVEASANELGGIDIVVANVSALDMNRTDDAFRAEFEVDLLHTVRTVDAALPHLERSDAGAIVVISSVSGLEFDFASPAYGTFKGALVHYASRMASELAGKHIRVNTVSPGNIYFEGGVWPHIERTMPDLFKKAFDLNPWGRMGKPEEIAKAAAFLASPVSSFTTGANLVIDGALTRRVQY